MDLAHKKVRSWCEECEAWHPRGMHVTEPRAQSAESAQSAPSAHSAPSAQSAPSVHSGIDLRAEPRPVSSGASTLHERARVSGGSPWLRLAIFLFVILPIGVVAWSAAAYAVLLILPHIKTALP